jgi:cellobiose epimerase
MMKGIFVAFFLLAGVFVSAQKQSSTKAGASNERSQIATEMEKSIQTELLNKWYPQSIDSLYGGFLSTFTYNFLPTGPQDKMIVTQARHVWSNAIASRLYPRVVY